ncbi:MAG: hypothetical protein ACRDJW_18235 [Thermomicrobiales bacterium]
MRATAAYSATDYLFRDEGAVRAYLDEHPEVIPALVEASRLLPHSFGMNAAIVLDVLTDPEEPDATNLFALIRTSLEPNEALPLLDDFNERWWRPVSATFDADVHFGLDYV